MNKQSFINLIKDSAVSGYSKYKILPSLTIAQAALESGWGKYSIGNNIFGIKADKSWKGKVQTVSTKEYINGKEVTIKADFRDYNSVYESLEDRFKFLSTKRYAKVVGATNYKVACNEIQKAGYATDPNYAKKLISIIEQNNLQQFDLEQPSSWAVESWEWAKSNRILDGTRPKDNLTNNEFIVILERLVFQ